MELLKIRFMKEVLHFILWSYEQAGHRHRVYPSVKLIYDLQDYESELRA